MALLPKPPNNPPFLDPYRRFFQTTPLTVQDYSFNPQLVLEPQGLIYSSTGEENKQMFHLRCDDTTIHRISTTIIRGKPGVFNHFTGGIELVPEECALHKRYTLEPLGLHSIQKVLDDVHHALPIHMITALTIFVDPKKAIRANFPLCTTGQGGYLPLLSREGRVVLCRLVYNPSAFQQRWTLFECESSLQSIPAGSVILFANRR